VADFAFLGLRLLFAELFVGRLLAILDRILEAFNCATKVTADVAQLLGAKDQHDDDEDNEELPDTNAGQHGYSPCGEREFFSSMPDRPKRLSSSASTWSGLAPSLLSITME